MVVAAVAAVDGTTCLQQDGGWGAARICQPPIIVQPVGPASGGATSLNPPFFRLARWARLGRPPALPPVPPCLLVPRPSPATRSHGGYTRSLPQCPLVAPT